MRRGRWVGLLCSSDEVDLGQCGGGGKKNGDGEEKNADGGRLKRYFAPKGD